MPPGARRGHDGGAPHPPAPGLSAFAAALSRHPVTSTAVGEVIGALLERTGPGAPSALLLATPGHAGALEDVVGSIHALLAPGRLSVTVASSLAAPGDDVTSGPGLLLWAGALPTAGPWRPGPTLVAAAAPVEGAEALTVGTGGGVEVLALAGLRRIGPVQVATRAAGPLVHDLDGTPAHACLLAAVADGLPAADLHLVDAGLRLATAGGSSVAVRGLDRASGALALAGDVPEGTPVAFAVRDPLQAAAEVGAAIEGRRPEAVLCAHLRGVRLGAVLPAAGASWDAPAPLAGAADAAVVALVAPRARG